MARNYMRTVNDMERYYYGAGSSMGYSYTGSELLMTLMKKSGASIV